MVKGVADEVLFEAFDVDDIGFSEAFSTGAVVINANWSF